MLFSSRHIVWLIAIACLLSIGLYLLYEAVLEIQEQEVVEEIVPSTPMLDEQETVATSQPAEIGDTFAKFSNPVDCRLGDTCWLVNLVDHDAGSAVKDFRCDQYSYDGHKGTDIAIRDLTVMADGVEVLAAAPGIVQGVRNGMDDVDVSVIGKEAVAGRECGNGLVIQHNEGWETQYCHMRKGSVRVESGQHVNAGDDLGYVGMSGLAVFPHLHLSVRHQGRVVDPFAAGTGVSADFGCESAKEPKSMWSEALRGQFPKILTSVYSLGFAGEVPKARLARAGKYNSKVIDSTASALVFWADVFWVHKNGRIDVKITGPDGGSFASTTVTPEQRQARRFIATGKKRQKDVWRTGIYIAEITVNTTDVEGTPQQIYRFAQIVVQ